jgi:hypothetical protein
MFQSLLCGLVSHMRPHRRGSLENPAKPLQLRQCIIPVKVDCRRHSEQKGSNLSWALK